MFLSEGTHTAKPQVSATKHPRTPPSRGTSAEPGTTAAWKEPERLAQGQGQAGRRNWARKQAKVVAKRSETGQLCWMQRLQLGPRAQGHVGSQMDTAPIPCIRRMAGWVQARCCWLLSPSQQTHTLQMFALFREGCETLGTAPLLLFSPRPLPHSPPSLSSKGSFATLVH